MERSQLLASLSPDEQAVLAALALVGDAAVDPDELAALAGVDDVAAAIQELERRGLVEGDGRVRDAWRDIAAAADRGERILERVVVFAESGRLSPETLLGVTEWALRTRRYHEALAIVRAAQRALRVVRSVEAWASLLHRALSAARALGDREAEAWAKAELSAAKPPAAPEWRPRLTRRLVQAAALTSAGAVGLAVGLVGIGEPSAPAAAPKVRTVLAVRDEPAVAEARPTPRVVTVRETATVTVTQPAVTVTTPTPAVTETVTTTVTVTVPPPQSGPAILAPPR